MTSIPWLLSIPALGSGPAPSSGGRAQHVLRNVAGDGGEGLDDFFAFSPR